MLRLVSSSTTTMPRLAACSETGSHRADLMDFIGGVSGCHALVIGCRSADLLCSLMQQGCSAATALRFEARPEAAAYDLAVAPWVTSAEWLDQAVDRAGRGLVPGGRFIACLVEGRAFCAEELLQRRGFGSIRTRHLPGQVFVRARRAARA